MALSGLVLAGSVDAQPVYRCKVDGATQIQNWPCGEEKPDGRMRTVEESRSQAVVHPTHIKPAALNITAYCEDLRDASGSYRLRNHCIERETEAKDRVTRMAIPPEITVYCNRLGEQSGSYRLMEHCIEREIEAKAAR
jgi:hypothetical protein